MPVASKVGVPPGFSVYLAVVTVWLPAASIVTSPPVVVSVTVPEPGTVSVLLSSASTGGAPVPMKNTAVASEALLALAIMVAMIVSVLASEVKVTEASPDVVVAVAELKVPWSVVKATVVPLGTGLPPGVVTVAVMVEAELPSASMFFGLATKIIPPGLEIKFIKVDTVAGSP